MQHQIISALAGAILLANAAQAAPDETASGVWRQVDNSGRVGSWFQISERNGLYEGRLVKIFKNPEIPPMSTLCLKCPGDQKNAPMLGLLIIKGMRRNGNRYQDGTILDPRDGSIYGAEMELSPDGQKLSVRGYLGIPLLGQTQVWTRLPDNEVPGEFPKE